jgi:hypothetical protein
MKRRKKSVLFSATLATAGIVAGSLVAINNSINAASELTMSLSDVTSKLSQELNIPIESVTASLEAQEFLAQVNDESILESQKAEGLIKSYGKVVGNFYIVKFDDARTTGVGYRSLIKNDAVNNIALSYPFKLIGAKRTTPSSSTNTNYGVGMMALDKYADSLSGKNNTIRVAVVDTGINPNHELFTESSSQDRIDTANGANALDTDFNDQGQCVGYTDNYIDDMDHGTMVSGLIAQSTPKNVKIVPVKTLNENGGLNSNSLAPIVCGALYAAENAEVVNMSLGIEQEYLDQSTMDALDDLFGEIEEITGAIMVAAAGNESASTIDYPAAAPSVITATSVESDNSFSSYSNHGVDADFATPGGHMWVACKNSSTCYANESGTSFSSPLLASAIADILMENPSYNKEQVIDVLKMNAEDLGSEGWDQYYGYGSVSFRINKFADISFDKVTPPADWVGANQTAYTAVKASSTKYNITKYALLEGDVATIPTSWTAISNPSKSIDTSYPVTKNGTYTLWYKNAGNEVKRTTFVVNKFDGVQPTINTDLSSSKVSDDSVKLSIAVSDNASGLAKIEWYFKLNSASDYTKEIETYTGETSQSTKTHTLSGLAAGSYTAYAKVFDKAGNYRDSGTVSFTIEQQADTITIGTPVVPTSWIKTDATVTVSVSGSVSNITHHAIMSGSETPESSDWKALSSPSKSFTDSITVPENGTYTIWYKNSTETAHKSFTVNKIDKVVPEATGLAASNLTSSSAKLSVTVSDNASGVSRIDWRYRTSSATENTVETKNYTDNATTATTKTFNLTGLTPDDYIASVVVYDAAGNTVTTDNITFTITDTGEVSDLVGINSVNVGNEWAKKISVEVDIESENSNITHRAIMNNDAEPTDSDWTAIATPSKAVKDTFEISANGTYKVWYKNESGNTASESFTVDKIDATAPTIQEALDAAEPEGKNITLSVTVMDGGSGLQKIEWYYKLEGSEGWAFETDYLNTNAGTSMTQDVAPATHTFNDLAAGNYTAYAKIFDNAGNITTSDEITFIIQADGDQPGDDGDDGDDTTTPDNPKTGDNIAIISSVGGAILAVGAVIIAKLRRIR